MLFFHRYIFISTYLASYFDISWCSYFLNNYVLVKIAIFNHHPSPIELSLTANGSYYTFDLEPRLNPITQMTKFIVVSGNRSEIIKQPMFLPTWSYFGTVRGDSDSYVEGHFDQNGIFDGWFYYRSEYYILEPGRPANNTFNAVFYNRGHIFSCDNSQESFTSSNISCETRTSNTISFQDGYPIVKHPFQFRILKPVKKFRSKRVYKIKHTHPMYLKSICEVKIIGDFSFSEAVENQLVSFELIKTALSSASSHFQHVDLDFDGNPERIGIFVKQFVLFREAVLPEDNPLYWNPKLFFKVLHSYDFNGYCAGLLFTHRRMTSAGHFRVSPISLEQGICSVNAPEIPPEKPGIVRDFGRYVRNALPINTLDILPSGINSSTENIIHMMTMTIMHQLAHLFGGMEEESYHDNNCSACHHDNPKSPFASTYPIRYDGTDKNFEFSTCVIQSMRQFLELNGRLCLKPCSSAACTEVLGSFNFPDPIEIQLVTYRAFTTLREKWELTKIPTAFRRTTGMPAWWTPTPDWLVICYTDSVVSSLLLSDVPTLVMLMILQLYFTDSVLKFHI